MDWRLIQDLPGEPAWNMAVDEAILESFCSGLVPPTIRIYSWNVPAISIGYFQDYFRSIKQGQDVQVVRRPTGGRAVAHGTDITFSLTAPSEIVGNRVGESYRRVGDAVARSLVGLGVKAAFSPAPGQQRMAEVIDCFDVAMKYEVSANGRKILGSAQTRRDGAVLQQNSLMVAPPPEEALFAIGSEGSCYVPINAPRETIAAALCNEIMREFQVTIAIGELTESEKTLAEELKHKYSSTEWTENRSVTR